MLYSCEFLRVGNETNGLDMLSLYFNSQDEQGVATRADDHSRLTIDFSQFNTIVLWQKAHRSQAKACHCITPGNGTERGLFDFPSSISPQGHLFGQQVHQGVHLTGLHGLEVAGEQLPVSLGGRREARSMVDKVLLRPAERSTAGSFTLAKHGGDLSKFVLKDFAQQEDGSLEGLELLKQHQERQRDRVLSVDTLLWICLFGSGCGDDWLR